MEASQYNISHCKMKHKCTFQENMDGNSKEVNTHTNTLTHDSTFILCSSNSISQLACDTKDEIPQQTQSLKNNTSLSENPFHLIKTISDGSVSLESIPTISLFKPDADEAYHNVSNKVSKVHELCNGRPLQSPNSKITILGGDKLPQSLVLFIKEQQKEKEPPVNKNIVYLCEENTEESVQSRKSSAPINDSDETDTEAIDSAPDPIGEKMTSLYSLQKSDTLILDSNKCNTYSKTELQCADTIILASETDQVHNLNPMYQDSIEAPTVLDCISTVSSRPFTVDNNQLISLDSSNNFQSADEILKKTMYLMSSDGQLTALSLSPEQTFLASVNQVGLFKNFEAKATQTELIFGTGNILFSSMENSRSKEMCELQTSLISVSDSSQQTQSLYSQSNENITLGKPLEDCYVQNALESKLPSPEIMSPILSVPCNSLETNNINMPMLKCIECQKEMGSKQEIKQHDKTHTKVFQCDLCNAKFTRLGNFTRHRKIHSLQPESYSLFKCETCGREFLQRCDLRRHMLIHTKQEPHRCDKCGKGYIRRSDLVVHLRFHNKDKAFKCKMCDKKFFQTGDLSRHIRRAHKPSSQLTCGHCDRKYASETTLIHHMKAVHKDIILHTVHQRLKESDKWHGCQASPNVGQRLCCCPETSLYSRDFIEEYQDVC